MQDRELDAIVQIEKALDGLRHRDKWRVLQFVEGRIKFDDDMQTFEGVDAGREETPDA